MIQNQFKYNLCEWSCGSRDNLSQTLSQCLKIMEKVKVENYRLHLIAHHNVGFNYLRWETAGED